MTARRVPGNDGRLASRQPAPPPAKAAKKARKKAAGRLDSFTKLAVAVVLINACAWVWCSYILAYLGRYEIAESLSQTAVTAIIGTFVTYAVKSLFENVNKNGINLKPTTTTTTTTTTTADAIIVGVNADLEG